MYIYIAHLERTPHRSAAACALEETISLSLPLSLSLSLSLLPGEDPK